MHLSSRSWLASLGLALLLPVASIAQSAAPAAPAPVQWTHLDPKANGQMGISTQRTYDELLKGRTAAPVVVAVIDSGVDTAHADLKSVLWRNPREIAGNGQDDDQNGYVDDVYGWNFLGGKDGRNIDVETYEDTRLLARLKPLYEGKTRSALPKARQAEFDLYTRVNKSYQEKLKEDRKQAESMGQMAAQFDGITGQLKQILGVSRLDTAVLRRPPVQDKDLRVVTTELYGMLKASGLPDMETVVEEMQKAGKAAKTRVEYSLNLAFNPRKEIIGDDPDNVQDRNYGNPDVTGPDALHGTHVAGIIAADRLNNLGVQGVAGPAVRIMALRAVPNGDEYDKDVANAIRYAVDNGASIVNMSFGKYFSPQRAAVEDAMRYAEQKGVLLVHSAGNESRNIDEVTQFPAPVFLAGSTVPNLLTVGASASTNDQNLAAGFSNYGKRVDVFAPGVGIYSTTPGSAYANESGTSMAAPTVSGVAAVLKSYFPQLTATDLKRIIMQSAQPVRTKVLRPGSKAHVEFAQLSSTGGVVNLYRAVELAQQHTAAKSGSGAASGK